jgi:hypothetical protein
MYIEKFNVNGDYRAFLRNGDTFSRICADEKNNVTHNITADEIISYIEKYDLEFDSLLTESEMGDILSQLYPKHW